MKPESISHVTDTYQVLKSNTLMISLTTTLMLMKSVT